MHIWNQRDRLHNRERNPRLQRPCLTDRGAVWLFPLASADGLYVAV